MPTDPPLDVPPELLEAWTRYPEIVKYGHPILREVAKPITRLSAETRELIQRMKRIMRDAHGLGLAAPQVGVSTRIIVYDALGGEGIQVLINPKILTKRGEQLEPVEGCLSIPGLQGTVSRAKEVRVKGFDERNRPVSRRAMDLEARVIQHEIDHLDGILFIDKVDQATLAWAIGSEDDEELTEESPE